MDVESSNLPRNLPRHRHHHHHQCHLARSDHVPLLLAPSVPSVTKYQSKPRPMPSGATPGASQPATDGSLTFSASQAASGASLVQHAGQLTWHEKHCQLTLPQAKGWKKCDTQPWGDRNLHLHLDHAEALAAMGLPDDGSNRSESCSTPSSLSRSSPADERVRLQIAAARARKQHQRLASSRLLLMASSTPGIYASAALAAPPRPTTRSRPSQAPRQRTQQRSQTPPRSRSTSSHRGLQRGVHSQVSTSGAASSGGASQPAIMKGPLPTRFTIETIIRRYHAEDRQAYTYKEFLYHYAVQRGWPVESVRTFWERLPRARDHLLV